MGSIIVKYEELLSFSIEQLFYQNRICAEYKTTPQLDFVCEPTPECTQLLQRLDFIFKKAERTGGFSVYGRVLGQNAGGNYVLRFKPRQTDKLTFFVYLNNPSSLNFNELPTGNSEESILYFSNQQTDVAATRDNLHLTTNSDGVNGVADSIKGSNQVFSFHSPVIVATDTAKVKHLLTGSEIKPSSLISYSGESDLTFNLSSFPLGKCQLLINNVVTNEFYYSGKPTSNKLFAIVELNLSTLLDANYRIIEADNSLTTVRPFYKVLFKNRGTFWRYSVRFETSSPLFLEMAAMTPAEREDFINNLNIENVDNTVAFTRTVLSDKLFVFKSNTPHLLKEKYTSTETLTLYKNISVDKKAVRTNLQFPDTGVLDATNSIEIYSDVTLTL
ncbi:MAG: hypothetical protein IPP71_10425 [Bacteroidetes bacterium]|nr:hypothetical protein [Bacteroidota bacterium]